MSIFGHLSGKPLASQGRQRRLLQKTGCNSGAPNYIPRSFMAKTSWINRNDRKRATVKKYAAVRAELKAKKDYAGLTQLPRDASPTRVVNRCEVTGAAALLFAASRFRD